MSWNISIFFLFYMKYYLNHYRMSWILWKTEKITEKSHITSSSFKSEKIIILSSSKLAKTINLRRWGDYSVSTAKTLKIKNNFLHPLCSYPPTTSKPKKMKEKRWKVKGHNNLEMVPNLKIKGDQGGEEGGMVEIIPSSCHFEKPSSRASLIQGCRQHSVASGIVSQLLLRRLCSGQVSSSSFTYNANMYALHNPSGLNSSWSVLLLKL